jgi:hypothetical protein
VNCFIHQDRPAVGLCKSCGRGLCPECLTEYPDGLACKNRCEARVGLINRIIDNNRNTIAAGNAQIRSATVLMISLGLLFCALGLLPAITAQGKEAIIFGLWFAAIGFVFLVTGLLRFRKRTKFPDI